MARYTVPGHGVPETGCESIKKSLHTMCRDFTVGYVSGPGLPQKGKLRPKFI